jgi:hypothetical protein
MEGYTMTPAEAAERHRIREHITAEMPGSDPVVVLYRLHGFVFVQARARVFHDGVGGEFFDVAVSRPTAMEALACMGRRLGVPARKGGA